MRAAGEERGKDPQEGRNTGPTADSTLPLVRESAAHRRTQRFVRPAAGGSAGTGESGADTERTRAFSRADHPGNGGGAPGPPRRHARPRRRRFRFRWIIALVTLVAFLVPVTSWGWVWYTARQDERPATDAIVVLGASQYNGSPSPIFEARLQHAVDLYRGGVAPVIITVGGNQPGDNHTEGGAGRDWLIQVGVPAEQVVAIGEGSDTLRSVEAVAQVFQQREWESAVIVSDPWHSLRSRLIADDFGIEAATSPARSGPAVQERQTQLWYITRETASLWYYWVFGDSSDVAVDAA